MLYVYRDIFRCVCVLFLVLFDLNRLVRLPVLVKAMNRFRRFASTDINSLLCPQNYYWLFTNVQHTFM